MTKQEKLNDYDSEPVRYCSKCYSLKVRYEESIDAECCMECGCADTKEASIEDWEKLYERRYGSKYVVKNSNPRNAPIFKLSISELKYKVFDHPKWKNIILTLYPRFPKIREKADAVFLLFNKLLKDNRIDDLRFLLLNQ